MKKKLYIELLEAEVQRLRDKVNSLSYDLRKKDPLHQAMLKFSTNMAKDMFAPSGIDVLRKSDLDTGPTDGIAPLDLPKD